MAVRNIRSNVPVGNGWSPLPVEDLFRPPFRAPNALTGASRDRAGLEHILGEENTQHLLSYAHQAVQQAYMAVNGRLPGEADVAARVTRLLGLLSPAEMRDIASANSAVLTSRAMEVVSADAAGARVAHNHHGPPPAGGGLTDAGISGFEAWQNRVLLGEAGRGRDGGRESYAEISTRWDASRPHSLSEANFHSAPFRSVGLDLSTTQDLFRQGFNTQQIMQAGRDLRGLGLNVNDNAAPAVRLNRDAPHVMPQMQTYSTALASVNATTGEIARAETRLRELQNQGQGNSQEAATLQATIERQRQQLEQRQQAAERAGSRLGNTVDTLPPGQTRTDAENLRRQIEENAERQSQLRGDRAMDDRAQPDRSDTTGRLGVQGRVQEQHDRTATDLSARSDIVHNENAELAALVAAATQPPPAPPQGTTVPPPTGNITQPPPPAAPPPAPRPG